VTSIRERVLNILDSSSLSDPRDIAEKILGDLAARERRDALVEVLPEYVRITIGRERHRPASDDPASGDPQNQSTNAGSSRWRRAASVLARRYMPIDTWKPLRDCTRDDVLALVAGYRDRAVQNTHKAEQFEALAAQMAKAKAPTVGALSEDVVEEILR
jgi:hypothetical protein